MRKPKILFIVEAMGGGIFSYIVDLSNNLVNNYDVYIAYGIRKQTPQDYKKYFDSKIHLIKVNNFARSLNPVKDIMAFLEIKTLVRKIKPGIVHLHSSKAGILGRWAINGKKIPLFYTPHGYSFLMTNFNHYKKELFKFIEKVSATRRCITVSCSRGEHKETLKLTKNAVFINNGINIAEIEQISSEGDEFNKTKLIDHNRVVVYTVGRINYQKNPQLFNEIAKKFPSFKFVWIGDGPLKNFLTSTNIQITGWLERSKVIQLCKGGDIFILTSLWEGLPIALLESMYLKKICIVNDTIGNRDVIKNKENGLICGSLEDFVNAIKLSTMPENKKDISRYKQNAYKDILDNYNISTMSNAYIELYNSFLNSDIKGREK